ncbi:FG-GAP-like repeat-containing protein [Nostoc sp. XA010]|uniref:FG-GAP-like repeat-containing protein n=1 Tax=Nostoc sp. XA010 TaxID=2780407 RepID=UPI001E2F4099|nr:FG-GAP-like repeat-containing protein [Nostoc sp. XA010]MCC5662011.1 FG-GAP-like repeat-containing protein [Nostoc sp. XA010]
MSNGTFSSQFQANDGFNVNGGGWTSFDKYPRQLADVNGDGRADIVGFGEDAVFVSLGQSNGTFGSQFQANDGFNVNGGGWISFDKYPRQVADVNGDGRADIVGFGENAVFVSLGQTNGKFGSQFQANDGFNVNGGGWISFDKYPRQLADVNGDGRADIVGFGENAVFVSLAQSNNTINGGSGNDILNGGAGNDTFKGSQGNDNINGGDGIDTVDYSQLGQTITLSGVGTIQKAGGLGQDQLFKVEKIIANANVANNTIDTSQSLPEVSITVNLQTQSLAANNVPVLGTLSFTAINFDNVIGTNANDSIVGDNQNNQLSGNNGNDTINGSSGNDRLIGDSGTDLLTGGSGNDIFDFNSVSESKPGLLQDVITDFVGNGNLAGDQIDLSTIDANPFIDGDQAFTYIETAAFSAVGQIRYVGGILRGNTNFDFDADFEIQIQGAPALALFVVAGNPTSDIIL